MKIPSPCSTHSHPVFVREDDRSGRGPCMSSFGFQHSIEGDIILRGRAGRPGIGSARLAWDSYALNGICGKSISASLRGPYRVRHNCWVNGLWFTSKSVTKHYTEQIMYKLQQSFLDSHTIWVKHFWASFCFLGESSFYNVKEYLPHCDMEVLLVRDILLRLAPFR